MICYLDSSVILRQLLRQQGSLKHWGEWDEAYASAIMRLEVLRAIDRLRLQGFITDEEVALSVQEFHSLLEHLGEIHVGQSILSRAALPFPTVIGTLDAIHLASALLWQERYQCPLIFLTHDKQLGNAALAIGMQAQGWSPEGSGLK